MELAADLDTVRASPVSKKLEARWEQMRSMHLDASLHMSALHSQNLPTSFVMLSSLCTRLVHPNQRQLLPQEKVVKEIAEIVKGTSEVSKLLEATPE